MSNGKKIDPPEEQPVDVGPLGGQILPIAEPSGQGLSPAWTFTIPTPIGPIPPLAAGAKVAEEAWKTAKEGGPAMVGGSIGTAAGGLPGGMIGGAAGQFAKELYETPVGGWEFLTDFPMWSRVGAAGLSMGAGEVAGRGVMQFLPKGRAAAAALSSTPAQEFRRNWWRPFWSPTGASTVVPLQQQAVQEVLGPGQQLYTPETIRAELEAGLAQQVKAEQAGKLANVRVPAPAIAAQVGPPPGELTPLVETAKATRKGMARASAKAARQQGYEYIDQELANPKYTKDTGEIPVHAYKVKGDLHFEYNDAPMQLPVMLADVQRGTGFTAVESAAQELRSTMGKEGWELIPTKFKKILDRIYDVNKTGGIVNIPYREAASWQTDLAHMMRQAELNRGHNWPMYHAASRLRDALRLAMDQALVNAGADTAAIKAAEKNAALAWFRHIQQMDSPVARWVQRMVEKGKFGAITRGEVGEVAKPYMEAQYGQRLTKVSARANLDRAMSSGEQAAYNALDAGTDPAVAYRKAFSKVFESSGETNLRAWYGKELDDIRNILGREPSTGLPLPKRSLVMRLYQEAVRGDMDPASYVDRVAGSGRLGNLNRILGPAKTQQVRARYIEGIIRSGKYNAWLENEEARKALSAGDATLERNLTVIMTALSKAKNQAGWVKEGLRVLGTGIQIAGPPGTYRVGTGIRWLASQMSTPEGSKAVVRAIPKIRWYQRAGMGAMYGAATGVRLPPPTPPPAPIVTMGNPEEYFSSPERP